MDLRSAACAHLAQPAGTPRYYHEPIQLKRQHVRCNRLILFQAPFLYSDRIAIPTTLSCWQRGRKLQIGLLRAGFHSWSAEERSSEELCPFLEPEANWTSIQADFEWTSEDTDESLGHGADTTFRPKSPDRCLVQTRTSLEPADGNEVRDGGGITHSTPTPPRKAGVEGRLYHLTTGGLIGVRRSAL
jgi:hypothetical protein